MQAFQIREEDPIDSIGPVGSAEIVGQRLVRESPPIPRELERLEQRVEPLTFADLDRTRK